MKPNIWRLEQRALTLPQVSTLSSSYLLLVLCSAPSVHNRLYNHEEGPY